MFSGEIIKICIFDDLLGEYEVIGIIEIGYYMDYIIVLLDGCVIYVNWVDIFGDEGVVFNIGEFGELIVIDVVMDEIFWCFVIEGMMYYMLVLKDGCYVFVLFWDFFWFVVVDIEMWQFKKKIYMGYGGYGSKVLYDGKCVYVGLMFIDQFWVIDMESFEVIDCINFDDGVCFFVLVKDDLCVYVQFLWLYGFDVVDLLSKCKVGCVMMLMLGCLFEIFEEYLYNVNYGIVVLFDGKMLFSVGSIIDIVVKFLLFDLWFEGMVDVGKDLNLIVYLKDGMFVYVSNCKEDMLFVLCVDILEEVQ